MSSNQTAPSDSSLQGQYAGFVTRLFAILVDMLLVIATMIILGLAMDLLLRFFNIDDYVRNAFEGLAGSSGMIGSIVRMLAALGTFYFVFFLYYITLHASTGGVTLGKALMGLRVVRMDGKPLSLGRCTRRYICFLLAAIPLFAGLLWVIIDDRRQGWHDKLAVTCVIYDWPAQEDERFLSGLRTRLRYVQETRNRIIDDSDKAVAAPAAENIT